MSDDIKMNELKIENHGVIPKEEEHTTPEELYERLVEKIKKYLTKTYCYQTHFSEISKLQGNCNIVKSILESYNLRQSVLRLIPRRFAAFD